MLALTRRDNAVFPDRDHPPPTPTPGCAIIKPLLCAVSQADLAVARGDVPFTGVLGHRFVGRVTSIDDPAGRYEHLRDARVVADIDIADAKSELSRRGLGRHDPGRGITGLVDAPGCFAEQISLPLTLLTAVDDAVPDEAAVLAVPLADAIHAGRIVKLEGKQYVTVIGDNLQAFLTAQIMALRNHSVRILSTNAARLSLAERRGVKHRHADEVGRRSDQDLVIACDLAAPMLDLALALVRPRGHLVLTSDPLPLPGLPIPPGRGVDLTPAVLHEIEIHGARTGRVADAADLFASTNAEGNPIDFAGLIGKTYPLDAAVTALRDAAQDDLPIALIKP